MQPRIYHGKLTPENIASSLLARFNRGPLRAQQFSSEDKTIVQIATREGARSGGQTALTITLHKVEDGVAVQIGKQTWLGVAASLGMTAFTALRNPLNLLNRLDDLAQDIENIQLTNEVFETIDSLARSTGASFELSERLKRITCLYCSTANPVGEPACIACGAPLGHAQPRTCKNCGFVIIGEESVCPNCGQRL
ncbi:MAG: zinc ribbon domain-containing protein [Chloroflexi bacterium]|nr:MAG: zinc ribbon domain-containing protein [Chloroflexota bacterium]